MNPQVPFRLIVRAPLEKLYTYLGPADMPPGSIVDVPLGGRRLPALVWEHDTATHHKHPLKSIEGIAPGLPLEATFLTFLQRMADYTLTPLGRVVKAALPVPKPTTPPRQETFLALETNPPPQARWTPRRRLVLAALEAQQPQSAKALMAATGVSPVVLKAMLKAGLLKEQPPPPVMAQPRHTIVLNANQNAAARALIAATATPTFKVAVLDGATGSGKTEVYFQAIEAALQRNRNVLTLLPEIVLSEAWVQRFYQRFNFYPALWHSELTPGARARLYHELLHNRIRVLIGARSAILLPLRNPGLIIIDEEHDPGYKQDESLIYHARDMALLRAQSQSCPVVLVSATPSMETLHNIQHRGFLHIKLEGRAHTAPPPRITPIHLLQPPLPPRQWLSSTMTQAIRDNLQRGEQTLLFLNRKGYAPLVLCRECGYRFECQHCSAWLVEHKNGDLRCHHCDHRQPKPQACPKCQNRDHLISIGPGVERIEEEVCALFPQTRTQTLTSGTIARRSLWQSFMASMTAGDIDILIATQIMAKGHHFPKLTLVGVVDADAGLQGGDPRAGERTYQLLHQLAGRAGREDRQGQVLLQTINPNTPLIQALCAGDRDGYMAAEAAMRRSARWPPWGYLAAVIVSGENPDGVQNFAALMKRNLPRHPEVSVLGPAQAPLWKIKGRYRVRFLVRACVRPQAFLRAWMGSVRPPRSLRIAVDIDPYTFL